MGYVQVNQAVDGMSEEKVRLEAEVQELRLELTTMEQTKGESQREVARLTDRINTITEQLVGRTTNIETLGFRVLSMYLF